MARVVLTQAAPRCEALAARLRGRGHEALALGLTRIVEREHDARLREAIGRLGSYDVVVLVSPAAVQAAARLAPDWPPDTVAAVVGPGSRAALEDATFRRAPLRVVSPEAPPFDAAALACLPPLDDPSACRVLVLRGERGSDAWIDALRERGARVDVLAAYRHALQEPEAAALEMLRRWLADENRPVCFVVAQAAGVARLDAFLERARLRERATRQPALAIHPRIAQALRDAGWRDVRNIDPGERALLLALESASDSSSPDGV
ncbi:MAG: uroporphyrinogen-III synthase [Burkholderiaceae bacterium]|nr:uroporphyrinogen-III synthase [Burkholderiaceae bacterium]